MTLQAGWRQRLVDTDDLQREWTALPPKALLVKGTERRFSREVDLTTAKALSSRGLPVYVISFDASGKLQRDDLDAFLSAHHAAFEDHDEHGAEAVARVYGRRSNGKDHRVLALVLVA